MYNQKREHEQTLTTSQWRTTTKTQKTAKQKGNNKHITKH